MKRCAFVLMLALSSSSFSFAAINTEDFKLLAQKCAANVSFDTLHALVKTESSFNPFAIGVVNGTITQPTSLQSALISVQKLERDGKNYSVGLGQINKSNFAKLNLTAEQLFDPCINLQATAKVLTDCYIQAKGSEEQRLGKALSCYYSGNDQLGFKLGYVDQVKNNAQIKIPSIRKLQQSSNQDLVVKVDSVNDGLIF